MAVCTYCENDRKLSREHIIPNYIYEYQTTNIGGNSGWNDKAQKLLSTEFKIKDVCEDCNNVKLGDLDGYSKYFLETNNFLVENFTQQKSNISYNYEKLHRWILKVTYNSARAMGKEISQFERYKRYIIYGEPLPKDIDNFLIVGLLKPEIMSAEERIELKEKGIELTDNLEFNPFLFRISELHHSDTSFVLKSLIIGPLVFLIPLFSGELKIGFKRSKIRSFIKNNSGFDLVPSNRSNCLLKQVNFTWLDAYSDQVMKQNIGNS